MIESRQFCFLLGLTGVHSQSAAGESAAAVAIICDVSTGIFMLTFHDIANQEDVLCPTSINNAKGDDLTFRVKDDYAIMAI